MSFHRHKEEKCFIINLITEIQKKYSSRKLGIWKYLLENRLKLISLVVSISQQWKGQIQWCTPVISTSVKQKQEDQEFKVTIDYIASLKAAWETENESQNSQVKSSNFSILRRVELKEGILFWCQNLLESKCLVFIIFKKNIFREITERRVT